MAHGSDRTTHSSAELSGSGAPRPPARGSLAALAQLATGASGRWRGSPRLRRALVFCWGLGLVLSVPGGISAGILGSDLVPAIAWAAVWWLATSLVLLLALPLLRTFPDQHPLEGMGLPNQLTAVRAYLALPLLLLAVMPPLTEGRALLLAVGAPIAVLDSADGWIARHVGPVTVLGRVLDPVMDTVFFSVCAIAALWTSLLPAWLAALILARYALPAIAFLILYPWLRRRPDLVATGWGKTSTFAGAAAVGVGGTLVIAGGPASAFDLALGVVLGVATLVHFAALVRRTTGAGA